MCTAKLTTQPKREMEMQVTQMWMGINVSRERNTDGSIRQVCFPTIGPVLILGLSLPTSGHMFKGVSVQGTEMKCTAPATKKRKLKWLALIMLFTVLLLEWLHCAHMKEAKENNTEELGHPKI